MCKCSSHKITCTVKHVLSGHHWDKEKVALKDRCTLKRDSICIKFSATGQ